MEPLEWKERWERMKNAPIGSETYREWEEIDEVRSRLTWIEAKDALFLPESRQDCIYLHWAANSPEALLEAIRTAVLPHLQTEATGKRNRLSMEFVPAEIVSNLAALGFRVASHFVDYWKEGLENSLSPAAASITVRPLREEETETVSRITFSCVPYSRGFFGEDSAVFKEWLETPHSVILAAVSQETIVGICLLRVYGHESAKGPVLWLRELAVNPERHGQGIGTALATAALEWGRGQGANRSFLATDTENRTAVRLYERLGYHRSPESGQINMEWKEN